MSSFHEDRRAREDNRNEHRLRSARPIGIPIVPHDALEHVRNRVRELILEQPHLPGEDPKGLYSRVVVPTSLITYESALNRAAIAVLLVAAIERRDAVDITSGDAA